METKASQGISFPGIRQLYLLISSILITSLSVYSQQYIADYTIAKEEVLRSIPTEYIDKARRDLVIAYEHTSHGTHVAYGVFGLPEFETGDDQLFGVSRNDEAEELHFLDDALKAYAPEGVDASDLSTEETAFIQTTRNFLDAAENATVNVVMWSWCNIEWHDVTGNYLPGMDSLISEYGPGGTKIGTGAGQREIPVSFIYMTGHPNEDDNVGPGKPRDQAALINDYCIANGRFCLDYYSIDSHDMEDNYYEDVGDDGNSASYGGNFYKDWQNSHDLGVDYFENKYSPGGTATFGEHLSQHITANRKAYAFWWILARIAGWDGTSSTVLVDEINVSSEGGVSTLAVGESVQINAEVLPSNASFQTVTWSVENDSGEATITQAGLLTAVSAGSVSIRATAQDGTGVSGSFQIQIEDPVYPVISIVVSSVGGGNDVLRGENLQLFAEILPVNASNKDISWSVSPQTGSATITQAGLLSAVSEGTVLVIATAQDGSEVSGSLQINITAPVYLVTSIVVSSEGGVVEMLSGESLQFTASILPSNASNKSITWSVDETSGLAFITQAGLLTAISAGSVSVKATAQDGSDVTGSFLITITDPVVEVSSITISAGGHSVLTTGESLQLNAEVLPSNATNKSISWGVTNQTGSATLTQTGLLSGVSAGTILVKATAQDGSEVEGTLSLTIVDPEILVSVITLSAEGGVTEILTGETLQFSAVVNPSNATNKSVEWNVSQETGSATITQAGLLTAVKSGTVRVTATALDGSEVWGSLPIIITEPDVPVTSIQVSSEGGVSEIMAGESLQFSATVLPAGASNSDISWSVSDESGSASITPEGLLISMSAGTVTVIAEAMDGSEVTGSMQISISDEVIHMVFIEVHAVGQVREVLKGETLQFLAAMYPENATNKEIIWSVVNHHGTASITQAGLLTALAPGTITVEAVAQDGSGIKGSMVLNIINQDIPVSSLQMTTVGGSCNIIIGWTLQFLAALLPADASNKEIIWSVTNQSGSASITQAGLLTAQTAGTVKVKAATLDGSGIAVSKTVTITSPEVPVSSIQIIPENGISQIYTGNTLKLSADVLPQDASNPAVTWDVRSQGGLGSVSPDGVFTGIQEGFVKVIACSTDGTGISDTMEVEIVTPVSIGENDMGKMLLYPNPGSGFFFLNAGDISIGLIEVVDPGGKILKQMTPGKSAGALHLDLNGYPAGYYFIRVYTPEGVYHQKLIIY